MASCGGNHGYEAAFAMVYLDADGNALDGANRHELRSDREPPVGAFWSVMIYDDTDVCLVANPTDQSATAPPGYAPIPTPASRSSCSAASPPTPIAAPKSFRPLRGPRRSCACTN